DRRESRCRPANRRWFRLAATVRAARPRRGEAGAGVAPSGRAFPAPPLPALRSAVGLARSRFRGEAGRALFVGLAAHSMVPLDRPLTAAFGLVLGTYAHAVGWPLVRGGTAAVTDAMAD